MLGLHGFVVVQKLEASNKQYNIPRWTRITCILQVIKQAICISRCIWITCIQVISLNKKQLWNKQKHKTDCSPTQMNMHLQKYTTNNRNYWHFLFHLIFCFYYSLYQHQTYNTHQQNWFPLIIPTLAFLIDIWILVVLIVLDQS